MSRKSLPILAILLLAGLLCLLNLGSGSIWADEALEYWTASADVPHLLESIRTQIFDPPFELLLR